MPEAHHPDTKMQGGTSNGRGKMKIAFTLAEVLITLGIIGIVAAMTMPTLMANHRKKETVTKLKKFYSVVNQAIGMSVAEYGEASGWAADCGTFANTTCTTDEAVEWFNKYIGKHLEIIKIEKSDENRCFYVYLKDGSVWRIANYIYDMGFFTDKKAITNPKSGVNSFGFRFNPVIPTGQTIEQNRYTLKPTIEPYAHTWNGTRDELLNKPTYGCKFPGGSYCAKLIQYDGWQIKDDYPVKF